MRPAEGLRAAPGPVFARMLLGLRESGVDPWTSSGSGLRTLAFPGIVSGVCFCKALPGFCRSGARPGTLRWCSRTTTHSSGRTSTFASLAISATASPAANLSSTGASFQAASTICDIRASWFSTAGACWNSFAGSISGCDICFHQCLCDLTVILQHRPLHHHL